MVAFIYHFYNTSGCLDIEQHKEAPVILSIASLRAFNKSVKIYVLDRTFGKTNWKQWSDLLNFKVIFINGYFEKTSINLDTKDIRFMQEKVFDIASFIETIPESHIVYCDADIFWIKDPLPLEFDKFSFSIQQNKKINSGFYFFDKNKNDHKVFFTLWQHYLLKSLVDKNFATILKKEAKYECISDESSLIYTADQIDDFFYSKTFVVRNVMKEEDLLNIQDEKGIHCIWLYKIDKRKFCLEHEILSSIVKPFLIQRKYFL